MKKPLLGPLQFLKGELAIGWIIIVYSIVVLAIAMTSCSDDESAPADPQRQIENTWVLDPDGAVIKDDEDVTDEYPGLAITFLPNGTYEASNNKHLFKSSGTWNWKDTGTGSLMLDGDFPATVVLLDDETLQLRFTLDIDDVNGRVSALIGDYDVTLHAEQ